VAWGDYDNDGDLDLYLANALSANKLFDNDGAGGFSDATSALLGDSNSGQGVATADYDNDGDLDIYLVNAFTFDKFFRNDLPAGNHWLHVDLAGTVSNRSGIGARVRVVAGGLSQIREISGGAGYLSQSSLAAEFGLGATTIVDTLEIRWPSGLVETWVDGFWAAPVIPIDTLLTIVEGDIATDVGNETAAPTVFRLYPNVPNPFNPVTTLQYDLPEASRVNLRIYDVAGRLVRVLERAVHRAPGQHRALWDGGDESGRGVSSGIYFYTLEAGDFRQVRKMVLLR
jgi:hypothetical protein